MATDPNTVAPSAAPKTNTRTGTEQRTTFPSDVEKNGFNESQKSTKSSATRVDALWLREVFSIAVAFASLAVTVTILAIYHNRTISDWPKMISINTLIAVFMIIYKPALSFPVIRCFDEIKWVLRSPARSFKNLNTIDAAIRGPWGSFLLLFKRFSKLAQLGAVITILSLAVDPFVQQMVKYYSCNRQLIGVNAIIARTNDYASPGTHSGSNKPNFVGDFAQSVYTGLVSPPVNATSSVSFDCASGNCTWVAKEGVAYNTLAMCFDIIDLTDKVESGPTGQQGANGPFTNSTGQQGATDQVTSYTLPSRNGNEVLNVSQRTGSTFLASSVGSLELNPDNAPGFEFEVLMLTQRCGENDFYGDCFSPFAFGAHLYPCVNSYGNVSVINSTLYEQVIASTPLVFMNGDPSSSNYEFSLAGDFPASPDVDCTPSSTSNGTKTITGFLADDGKRYFQGKYLAPTNQTAVYYDPHCTYSMTSEDMFGLSQAGVEGFFGPPHSLRAANGPSPRNVDGDQWLKSLYLEGKANLTSSREYVRALADSMTATIRANSEQDPQRKDYAQGIVLDNQTCIRVQWLWLILPAGVAALTLALMLLTMIAVRRNGRGRAPRGEDSDEAFAAVGDGGRDAATSAFSAVKETGFVRVTESFLR